VEHASNSNSAGAPTSEVPRLTVTVDIDWAGTPEELTQAVRAAFGSATHRLVVVDPDNRDPQEAPYLEGSVEVDDNALVSVSDDGGAYVQAWIWVSDEDAGVNSEED
jgi:hypothetical protein